jgi:UDP-glucose 4,6-dehydratase
MSFRREGDKDKIALRKNGDQRPLRCMLVTGGCGFIGSNFINYFGRAHPDVKIINLDKMDYCANEKSIEIADQPNYTLVRGDICNTDLVMLLFTQYDVDTVVHFAAQSHVDNSFGNSMTFTKNNVLGTHNLLECARVYGKIEKFIHVSTDEVYGEVTSSQHEHALLNPTYPYAATKAAAEFIVKSYMLSFGLPCIITRGNNVYGPYQYPEKVIPRFAMLVNEGEKMTIQGTGSNTRTFIHAFDVARAFSAIVERGVIGEIYNIGSRDEYSVLQIAERVVKVLKPGREVNDFVTYIPDRDFNDLRYDIHSDKLKQLGWEQQIPFEDGFRETVMWYVNTAFPQGFWPSIRKRINTASVDFPRGCDESFHR